MRIAYFINQYPKVSHSFIRREILSLEKQGVEVFRYALRGWDAEVVDGEDIEEKNKTLFVLENGLFGLLSPVVKLLVTAPMKFFETLLLALRSGWRAERPLLYHLIYFAEACKLLDFWRVSKPNHVHAHFGTNAAEIVMLARSLGGPPYSFTVHGPEEFDKPEALHLREKIRRAKFVVAISSYGRSQLYRQAAYADWSKVKVVHCGLEESFYDVPKHGFPDAKQLVCVGRLCEQKGQLLLVKAARQLLDKGVHLELVLAGDGEMRDTIESLIASSNLQDTVRITGWISSEQVRNEIIDSRALVLPSFAEGLPVVIMEALALRRPVLTTYVAGIPELVIDQENGWLFPAGSIDALADAMERCLTAPIETLSRMGDAGYERVIQRHNVDKEAAKLVDLFQAASS